MKILVTCPPMIGAFDKFADVFAEKSWVPIIPKFTQVMDENELCKILPQCDGWIIGDDPATLEVFTAGKAGKLKAAVKWGVGTDNVDFEACHNLGIPICNTPHMFGHEVADVALGYVINLARHLISIDREVRKGNWHKPQGISLNGKIAGVVGHGDIGRQVCHRLHAFGLRVVGWDPNVSSKIADRKTEMKPWPKMVNECDFIILTCALNSKTFHMLNHQTVSQLKKGAIVINVARGPLIDEAALIKSLQNGHLAGAALDVFQEEPMQKDHPLASMSNCILGSHNGSNTIEAVRRATQQAILLLEQNFDKQVIYD